MASEANTERHIPALYTQIANEIARMGLAVGFVFDVAGQEALTVTLDVDSGDGGPPEGFALVADGTADDTVALLRRASFEPETVGVSGGASTLSEDAAIIVVDPSPSEWLVPEYEGVGAVVLSDARFAARELANRAVEAGRELGFTLATEPARDVTDADSLEPQSDQCSDPETDTSQTEVSEAEDPIRQAGASWPADSTGQTTEHHVVPADGTTGDSQSYNARAQDPPDDEYDPLMGTAATVSGVDGGGDAMDTWASGQELMPDAGAAEIPDGRELPAAHDALDEADQQYTQTAPASGNPGPETGSAVSGSEQQTGDTADPHAETLDAEIPEAADATGVEPESEDAGEEPAAPAPQAPGSAPRSQEYAQTPVRPWPQDGYGDGDPVGDEVPPPAQSRATEQLEDLYDEEVFGPLSDYVQRLYHVREALAADAEDGRTLTPEKEKALAALESMGRGRSFYRELRAKFNRPPDELDRIVADAAAPEWSPITVSDAEGFIRNPYPGVLLFGNNKGGVGKTMTAVEVATAIATTGVPDGHERGIKVLLVEQNFANPDIRKRVKLPPGRPPGMIEYIEAMRTAEAAGGELPDLRGYVSHVQGLPTDNLYVLPIAADEGEWRHNGKVTTDDLDGVYEAAADAGFDVIVVDFQNGLPQAGNLTAETIGFWVSVADVMYLVVGRSEAVENGSEFMDGARALVEFYGHSCSLVPVFNEWHPGRSTNKRWGRGVSALGADTAIAPAQFIPSEFAGEYEDAESYGGGAYFHRIPSHPAAADFCLEKRQLCLESRMFKEPFYLLALDALTRIKRNRASYFESSGADSSTNTEGA